MGLLPTIPLLASSLALYLSNDPSDLYFMLRIDLQHTSLFPFGNLTISKVWLFPHVIISSFMVSFHGLKAKASQTKVEMSSLR